MKKKSLMLAMGLVLAPLTVHAADVNISGFASVIAGISLNDDTSYSPSPKYGQAIYDDDFTLAPESRFGIQMNAPVNEKFTATMQIVGYGANEWEPTIPWAYVSYQASDDIQIRAGRMRRPLYLFSDYIDVGYAYPWLSLPPEAYFVFADSMDAIDVIANFSTGILDHQVQAYIGSSSEKIEFADGTTANIQSTNAWGVIWSPSTDSMTFRVAYHTGEIDQDSIGLKGINDGLLVIHDVLSSGPVKSNVAELISATSPTGQTGSFIGLGARFDFDHYSIIAEYNIQEFDDFLSSKKKRSYISGIWNASEQVSTYLTFQQANDEEASYTPLPASLPAATGINPGLANLAAARESTGVSLGIRYEFMENVAVKAEYMTLDVEDEVDTTDVIRAGINLLF